MYGQFFNPPVQFQSFPTGVDTGAVQVIPTGTNTFYVRSTGAADYDPPALTGRIFTTLNAALGQCRSGRGDVVLVLEGHTESITTADQMSNLVANTKIIGRGFGNERPTFTWTTATSSFLFDVANTSLQNCILQMEPTTGTVNVAAPITVSAAGCSIVGCRIKCGTDANNKVTIGITTTAAADQFSFVGNRVFGAAAATCTTFLRLVGADDCEIAWNEITCGTTAAAVGVIQCLTTASTNISIHDNMLFNSATSSTAALTGMAGITGSVTNNKLRNTDNTSLAWVATPGNAAYFSNEGVNDVGERGNPALAGIAQSA